MTTRSDEFTTDALATLVRESCDEFYGDDTVLTDGVVERFEELLEKVRDGKVFVLVDAAKEDEPCEHEYGEVLVMVETPKYTQIRCLKCGEPEAAGEGVG